MRYFWILAGHPFASSSPFTDVPDNADYEEAISWADAHGVTNGTSANTFSPNRTYTRGQIVTFFLRYFMI